jgi:hypothetical protein
VSHGLSIRTETEIGLIVDDDPRSGSDPRERDGDMRDPGRGGPDPIDVRDRGEIDRRDVFVEKVDLPRGLERELVRDRDREYSIRGSEARTLSIIGAFRVVSSRDLRDQNDRPVDPRKGDLRRLREEGLVRTIPIAGSRDVAVVLTDRGRDSRTTFPIGIDRNDRWVLVYLATEADLDRFRLFLQRHFELFCQLPAWMLRIVVPPTWSRSGFWIVPSASDRGPRRG